ncbi:hypothetical protein Q7C36_007791 [Tachysurus vachellii]|uniref:Uncharacterized protein n=1 Tax=Tachysurus vachellii TaxID=175792 RepID=A0AA88NER8_TACVA|nr:hypothetical protein Q7C36_007791 [Tachysurus vachellii]
MVIESSSGLLAGLQLTGWLPAPTESLWAGPASHAGLPKPLPAELVEGTATVTSAPADSTHCAMLIRSDLFKSRDELRSSAPKNTSFSPPPPKAHLVPTEGADEAESTQGRSVNKPKDRKNKCLSIYHHQHQDATKHHERQ